MKKLLQLLAFTCIFHAANCQEKYWQQQTNYRIAVSLDDRDNSLTGNETIDYFNNSPDTLSFIWIHLWPNAYKNDRTAFSDQLLENGRTDFYFANENQRGYINRLNFKVDNVNALTEDHPQHRDIIKLLLPAPLVPGGKAKIETPFHVKLPYNFSRGGHVLQSYQVTQWYPKPAVYDKKGWHEISYLDQGEFYSEFGSFDVTITLPENYVVAATGELQDKPEKDWLKKRMNIIDDVRAKKTPGATFFPKKDSALIKIPASSVNTKSLHYIQNNVHDFAWFADKRFLVNGDTLKLNSGRIINLYAFVLPVNKGLWTNSIEFIKRAVRTKSAWVGEYPYDIISVVDNAASVGGGMEYPTITLLTAGGSERALESVINHEAGHNWFYGVLGTNERRYAWMDEGINTYYDKRYAAEYLNDDKKTVSKNNFISQRIPKNIEGNLLAADEAIKKDQPINTPSEKFSPVNYELIAYEKTGEWLQQLERTVGRENFDRLMQAYFEKWKFKHPYPEDFQAIAEQVSGQSLANNFKKLDEKGRLEKPHSKQIKLASFFNLKNTDRYNYISVAPAIGANHYDKLMIGALIHNYNLPPSRFLFVAAPLYATGTKKLNGIGHAEYNWFPGKNGDRVVLSAGFEKFTGNNFIDSANVKHPLQFIKAAPALKYVFANKNPRSHIKKYIQFKTYLVQEDGLFFSSDPATGNEKISYPKDQRYLNQLQAGVENNRVLYPYDALVNADQGNGFIRLDVTANYFFNYANKGGLAVRFFAGKFIYTGEKNFLSQYKTDRYHLNLTGPKGYEDYNYNNYFIGRNEFEGISNQQIMNRDGFFKVRTDLLSNKIGKTDDWLSAINFTTDIPKNINPLSILPFKIPLRLFADIGTYAEAWKTNSTTGRFLYDGGIELSLFRNFVNIYAPFLYSKVYRDYINSTIPEKKFLKNISFSIDIAQLRFSRLFPQAGL